MSATEPAVALPVVVVLPDGPKKFKQHRRWGNRERTLCGKEICDEAASDVEHGECVKCEEEFKSVEFEIGEILEKWRKWHGQPN